MKRENVIRSVLIFMVVSLAFGFLFEPSHDHMDMMRDDFISLKLTIQEEMRGNLMYRCCLEEPCTLCITESDHGGGASCDCLADIVNGVHPCGECIGEILEGNGNPYLSEYYAKALAEKLGHEDTLKLIIEEKYGIPIEEQL